jgi:predicted component of type VI protein secretion system
MKRILFLIAFLGVFTFLSCKSDNNYEAPSGDISYDNLSDNVQSEEEVDIESNIEKKLIKGGRVEFETFDLNLTRTTIANSLKKYNAYISTDQQYKSDIRISSVMTIRVPQNNFDNFLNEITVGITQFDVKDINVKDVTEEFLDVEARLKTKKELEARYLEILKKANSVKEILEVEREIGHLRSDIESIEGRLKYLSNQVAFSTLTVTFYQQIAESKQFGNKFKTSLKNGWENLIWFLIFLTNLWPFILLTVLAFIIIRYFKRRTKK